MGAITPPSGCMSSIEKCIEALCAEKSEGTGMIKWLNRMSELSTLGQLDENLSGDVVRGSCYETEGPIRGSIQYGKTQWASTETFSETLRNSHTSPLQKGSVRQKIAQRYLDDHPDDCQPPQPTQHQVPVQLPLFDELPLPTKATRFQSITVEPTRAWWTTGTIVAMGAVVALADKAATFFSAIGGMLGRGAMAAEAIPLSFATIGMRYYMDDMDQRRGEML